jgi:glycosyltransferase involved in cell wall biosynthesis
MNAPSVTILIPAFNEEATLPDLIAGLRRLTGVSEICVVDDGSTDGTRQAAERAGARVIAHLFQRGNGAAVKTGLQAATSEWVIIMDADGQHHPDDVENLLNAPWSYDLVVAARDFRWSRFRDFGNLFLIKATRLFGGLSVADLTSGLRRINRPLALKFRVFYPDGYSFPTTSTILFMTSGLNVQFIPIPNRVRPGHASTSKLHPFKEGVRFLFIIYRVVLISYPLRFFGPLGTGLMALGTLWTLRTLSYTHQVSAGGALLFLSGLTLLLFGTIADQLTQIRKSIAEIQ